MRSYLNILACVFLAMSPVILLQIAAKPDRQPPKKDAKYEYPDISAKETTWGKIDLDRRTGYFTITGHPQWTAEGQIFGSGPAKGKAYILWTYTADGRLAPGIYEIDKGNTLHGAWGYDDAVTVDETEWTIKGALHEDRIARAEWQEP